VVRGGSPAIPWPMGWLPSHPNRPESKPSINNSKLAWSPRTIPTSTFWLLQAVVPNIVSSINLSLKVVSTFNYRPFIPTPALPKPNPILIKPTTKLALPTHTHDPELVRARELEIEPASPMSMVRSMVVVCLMGQVLFAPIDSSTVLRKLEND
jgi:hypothetical protein